MDWLQFIVELCKAWPLAAVLIALIFRKPLQELITKRLDSIEGKGWKLTFKTAQDKVEELTPAPAAPPAIPPAEPQKALPPPEVIRPEDDLLANAPLGAIIASYTRFEDTLVKIAAQAKIPTTDSRKVSADLLNNGVITAKTAEAINVIRQLRNKIVHDPKFQQALTEVEANAFADMVAKVLFTAESELFQYLMTGKN